MQLTVLPEFCSLQLVCKQYVVITLCTVDAIAVPFVLLVATMLVVVVVGAVLILWKRKCGQRTCECLLADFSTTVYI